MQIDVGLVTPARGSREAYLVGNCIQKFDGWAESVRSVKDWPFGLPTSWNFPYCAFDNPWEHGVKDRLISRLVHSLRRLALMRAVDSVVLVEMHRICSELSRDFVEFMKSCKSHNDKGVAKYFRSIQYHWQFLEATGDELFTGQCSAVQDSYHLGVILGKALRLHVFEDQRDNIPLVMDEFIELGRKLLPKYALDEVIRLYNSQSRYVGVANRHDPAGKLISEILKLDKRVYIFNTPEIVKSVPRI